MMFCECLKEFISICLSPIVWAVILWQWVRVWAGERVFSLMWVQVLVWKQAYIRVSAFSPYVRVYIFAASLCVCVCVRVWVCESVSVWVCESVSVCVCVGVRACVSSCSFWRGEWVYKRKEGRSYRLGDFIFCFFPFFAKRNKKEWKFVAEIWTTSNETQFFPKTLHLLKQSGHRCTMHKIFLSTFSHARTTFQGPIHSNVPTPLEGEKTFWLSRIEPRSSTISMGFEIYI